MIKTALKHYIFESCIDVVFNEVLNNFTSNQTTIHDSLDIIVGFLPPTVILTTVDYAGNIFTVNGQAPSEEDILAYSEGLVDSNRFSEIVVASVRKLTEEEMGFTLTKI